MKMQTAVEWLATELYEKMNMYGNGRLFDSIFEQAKQMEKEQIKEAYCRGDDNIGAEQYYNETYNK